jgi:hypothetical protein
LRVNHNLDVHVADFVITPTKATVGVVPAKQATKKIAKAKG